MDFLATELARRVGCPADVGYDCPFSVCRATDDRRERAYETYRASCWLEIADA